MGMTFLTWLAAFFGSLLSSIAADEFKNGAGPLAAYIIGKAVERLPSDARATYREEWTALLLDLKSPTSRIAHATSLYLKAGKLSALLDGANSRRASQALRLLDLAVSAIVLPALVPMMVTVALGLYIERPNRPLFKRLRVQKSSGDAVYLYVFNTGREGNSGGLFSRVISLSNFAETPMLLGVLKGDVAFFGFASDKSTNGNLHYGLVPLVGEMDGSRRAAVRCWVLSWMHVAKLTFCSKRH